MFNHAYKLGIEKEFKFAYTTKKVIIAE